MNKEEKIKVLKSLKPGTIVTLSNGKVVEFVCMKTTKFIGKIDDTQYRIDADLFEVAGDEQAREIFAGYHKKIGDRQAELARKRKILKSLSIGDKIKLTNGEVVEFICLNRTRFEAGIYSYPIAYFDSVVEKAEPDARLELIRKLAKKYKGLEIQTVRGPSIIGPLAKKRQNVILYELGVKKYSLSLEDFLREMQDNGFGKNI